MQGEALEEGAVLLVGVGSCQARSMVFRALGCVLLSLLRLGFFGTDLSFQVAMSMVFFPSPTHPHCLLSSSDGLEEALDPGAIIPARTLIQGCLCYANQGRYWDWLLVYKHYPLSLSPGATTTMTVSNPQSLLPAK